MEALKPVPFRPTRSRSYPIGETGDELQGKTKEMRGKGEGVITIGLQRPDEAAATSPQQSEATVMSPLQRGVATSSPSDDCLSR